MQPKLNHPLPALEALLAGGGDARIVRGPDGTNKYGCFPVPHPEILAYGSSTASTISQAGLSAAAHIYQRLEHASRREAAPITYAREMARIQDELITLCGLYPLPGLNIIFGASGTDLHLFAAQLLRQADASLLVIMPEASETGGGVPAALQGRHFSTCAALGGAVVQGERVDAAHGIEIAVVNSRLENGDLRAAATIDAEVEALASSAALAGRHVLLTLTDISKTGLIIPSPACALALKRRFPAQIDILVDACQFRLSNATLRAYLAQDCLLAMTGSKFVTGPAFSAALLVPQKVAQRLRDHVLPPTLGLYSTRADWPSGWAAREALPDTANYGLLLRWEAALAELRAFHSLSETNITAFLETFAKAVQQRLESDPAFEPLATRSIDRDSLVSGKTWDQLPTIFPFRLRHPQSGRLLNKDEMTTIYERMKAERCQLGQPVACGALRLCVDMRLIADALSPEERGVDAVIAGAMRVMDKAAMLVGQLSI